MFAGGVAATLVLHCSNDDGVKQRIHSNRFAAGGIKIGMAGGFAAIRDQDDYLPPIRSLFRKRLGPKKNRIVNRGPSSRRDAPDRLLQPCHIV